MRKIYLLAFIFLLVTGEFSFGQVINTVVGTGISGFSGDGGAATAAKIWYPEMIATDAAGNLYIADYDNFSVRKVTSGGIISTIAGDGYGTYSLDGFAATSSSLDGPTGVATDASGNVYITETMAGLLRFVNTSGILCTMAGGGYSLGDGGAATAALLNTPVSVCTDGSGNIYIADWTAERIRMINPSGIITTVAGNGTSGYTGDGGAATAAEIYHPRGIKVDGAGNLYIADAGNNCIRKVNTSGVITTIAGTGTAGYTADGVAATSAELNVPFDIASDSLGNLYISDLSNNRIREVSSSGYITTVAGTGIAGFSGDGGSPTTAKISQPFGLAVGSLSSLYFADNGNNRIREITGLLNHISGVSSVCLGATTTLTYALSGGVWSSTHTAVATVGSGTGLVTGVSAGTTVISYTISGTAITDTISVVTMPTVAAIIGSVPIAVSGVVTLTDATTGGYWSSANAMIASVAGSTGFTTGVSPGTTLISYMVTNSCGSVVAQTTISVISACNWDISTYAGNGTTGYTGDGGAATTATLNAPVAIAVDASGNLYIADYNNSCVRKVSTAGVIRTIAGNGTAGYSGDGGAATAAELNGPAGVAVDGAGNVYISDEQNQRIRVVNSAGYIRTIAGTGSVGFSGDGSGASTAMIYNPQGLIYNGDIVFADGGNQRVREFDLVAGIIHTLAGNGSTGFSGDAGPATAASLGNPSDVSYDSYHGKLYIADPGNERIRVINPGGYIYTFAGHGVSGFSGDGGQATAAELNSPTGVSIDTSYNVYIADAGNARIRMVNSAGIISTVAGDGAYGYSGDGGAAVSAALELPGQVKIEGSDYIYIVDENENRVRKVSPAYYGADITGATSLCAGDSTALSDPTAGGAWFSANTAYATVGSTGMVTGVAAGLAVISYTYSSVCGSTVVTHTVTVNLTSLPAIAGSDTVYEGYSTGISDNIYGGTWSSSNTSVVGFVNTTSNPVVIAGVSLGTSIITYSVTNICGTYATTKPITVIVPSGCFGNITTFAGGGTTYYLGSGPATSATLLENYGIAIDGTGNVYVGDYGSVRKVGTDGTINLFAGTGYTGTLSGIGSSATLADIGTPWHVAVDRAGNVYMTDQVFNRVFKVNTSGIISVFAGTGSYGFSGDGGLATAAELDDPRGVAADTAGNVYITDFGNQRVRKINTSGYISTIAGTGSTGFAGDGGAAVSATFTYLTDVATDRSGNIYLADYCKVRKINTSGVISTVAGSSTIGFTGDGGPATIAKFNLINAITLDGSGNLYIGDEGNYRIRIVNTAGIVSTVAGNGSIGFTGDGGAATTAAIGETFGIAVDTTGRIFFSDAAYSRVRSVVQPVNLPGITGLDSICVGTSATFTDSLGGGAWSSSATSVAEVNSSGVVSGVASGTALISYTVTYPCGPEVVSKAITINPTPSHITGTETVCAGHTTSISDALAGGNWHSNNLLVATIITGGNWTGMSVGTAIISYNMPTGCSTWCTVSVNATPAAISVTPVCPITGNYLTDATSGGLWSSTNSAVGTIFPVAGYFTGLIAGTTIISYTLATGCYAAAVETVFPNPADITGTTNVCQTGGTDTLSDSTMGGYWISSNLAVVEIDLGTGALTGDIPGTATITYTVLSTGCMAEATVTTVADPPPFTGITEVCIGNVDTLGNTDAGGTWSSGNSAIATIGSVDGIADGMSEGVVNITYTVPGGCYYTSSITVFPGPTGITGNRNICVGAGTVLSDVWPGGSWISGNPAVAAVVTATGHVTGISAGSAIITYQLATNCMAMDTVTVGTIPLTISGGTSMCSNATATWTDVVSGGTWSSSRTTVATIGALTGTVSGVSAGTTVITYGTSVACYVTKILSVNTGPKAIAGLTAMCSTATVTLADSITGGTWVSSRTAVATIGATSGTVTGVTDGTTIISYTLTDGCAAGTLFTVAGGPLPIAGPGSACTGTVAALTDGIVGGSWSSLRTAVATIDSAGDAIGIAAGTTIITYTIGGGCLTTFTLAVHAGPAPIMGAASLCEGQHTTYTDASGSGTWYSNPATVATITATTGALSGVGPGTTIITYQLSTGCSAADTVSITGHPAAITGAGTSCTGGLLTWTDSTAGGTWTSGRTAVAAIGSLSGTLTAVSAGTAIITYTVGSGCITTATVAVIAGPAAVTGVSTVCMSGTAMLSDATTGGTWSCPWYYAGCATITTGGMVAGVNPGSAVVTYTLPTGCATTDTITTVNAPDPITGNPVLCVGSSEALGEEVFGGVWTSSATGVAAVISHLGIIAGIAAGTATITYSLGTGCMVTYNLTIVPLPASISGSLQLCAGTTAAAYDSTPGGTWHTAATGISITATSGTLTALTAGSYEITYTLPTGCTAMAYATVNPLPASIGGTPALCAGDTATLHDATPGGTWTATGSHAAISATTGLLTGASPGTATISYTLGTACAATAIAVINPPPGPITGMAALCVGYTETLTNDTSGGAWTATGAAVTVNTTTGLVTALAAGTALVSYTTGAGCFVAAPLTVSATPAAITGPANACAGATGVYTDPVTGGTWSSSSVAAGTIGATTGLFAGITTGATTLTYTLPTGCYTLLTLAVNAIPAALSGTDSVCVGDSAHLADPTPGGLWSSSSVPVATVSATGWVMGVASGYSTISYTVGGCSNTVGFSVNRQPMYIGGPDSVCADGGYVRLWDGDSDEGYWSSRAIGVDSLGIVEGYSAGTATVTFTLRTGCATARVMNVEPGPDDVMGGSPYVCTGGSALYTDATPGGYWVISPATVATVGSATGMVTGAGTGTASVSYILPVTGCFAKRTVLVNPQPMAITGPEGVCVGMSTTYSDSTAGGTWSGSAPAIFAVDTASGLMTGITFGTGTITYTITDSCGTATTTAPVAVSPLPDAGVITGSAAICVGQSFVVTGTATGGSWAQTDSVATLAGTTVTGTAAGADTVLYVADHSGCIAMATWPFVVLAIPDAGAIAGPGSICAGNEATYTDDEGGGAWSASNTHAAISPTGVVQGLSAGADTLVYTVSNAACQATAQTTLTIDPQPDAGSITGPAAVCVGDSIQLTDTAAGGAWTGGNLYATLTGNAASATATGISAGIMVASYTAVNSCGAAMATDTLQVASQPDAGYITGLQSLCVGDSVQLYDKTPGGLWSVTDTIIARVTAGTVYGATAGSDTILYTVTNYCGSATATYPVAVLALPQAPVIAQGAVNLTVTGGYNSYAWTDNGTAAGTTDSAIAYTPGDVYQVMVTGADGCPATSATYTATDCAPAEMVFYPNPAPALVYIIWCKPVTVKIMCDDGRLVKTIANTTVVNWSDLPNATYMLEIFDEHGNKVRSQRVEKITR